MTATEKHRLLVLKSLSFPGVAIVKRNPVEYKKAHRSSPKVMPPSMFCTFTRGGVRLSVVNEGRKEAVIEL
jgi:hypothetical protein